MDSKERGGHSPLKSKVTMRKIIILQITVIAMFFLSIEAFAEQWEDRYDHNTEITLKGKVAEIIVKDRGPVLIGVVKNERVYNVMTAPRWFIEESNINFSLSDEVVVYGSKYISRKGELFIIAREIHNISKGKIYVLREDDGYLPKWRQRGKKRKEGS